MKRLQILSDIHLERKVAFPKIRPIGKYLILAGDVGDPKKDNYRDFFSYCSDNWEKTFYVPGNHEYGCFVKKINSSHFTKKDVELTDEHIMAVLKFSNVVFLNSKKIIEKDLSIVGTTLWTPKVHPIFYQQALDFLKGTKGDIVITHHLPIKELIHPMYIKNPTIDRYYSELDCNIYKHVKYWFCGHSHSSIFLKKYGTKFFINTFDHDKQVVV